MLDWDHLIANAKTGDIFLYSGTHWYSKLIEYFSGSQFSHVTMILRDPTYINSKLKGLYIIESGYEGIPDAVDGKVHFGVQIVPIEQVRKSSIKNNTRLYYRKLEDVERDHKFKEELIKAYQIVRDKPYDLNPIDWIKAKFDIDFGDVQETDTFWCSALISYLYIELGLLDKRLPWSLIAPRRFSAFENRCLTFNNCILKDEVQVNLEKEEHDE